MRLNGMKKRAIVLGSTGSIGCNSLDVLHRLRDEWDVTAIAARSRCDELARQANQFRPGAVAIADGFRESDLLSKLEYRPRIFAGDSALLDLIASVPCDCVIVAVVGADALAATLRAVEMGRRIALANKEAIVLAGSLLVPLARRSGAQIIPVDSEHSAIFQSMQAGRAADVRKVYLTASGGPFRTWSREQIESATLEQAIRHPIWSMGPKISIDSATMMNKALEVVEARWLFDLRREQIDVLVHPESIIHSVVEFCDGSMIAQLSAPDMRTPIQYALTYPERRSAPAQTLDLASLRQLTFQPPDEERFPALRLGHEVAQRGGTSGAVLNGANEAAVELFREGAISFADITRRTEQALKEHTFKENPTLDDLVRADDWARKEVKRCMAC